MIELGNTSNAAADYCLVYNYYTSLGSPSSCAVSAQKTGDSGNVMGYFYQDNVNSSLSHTATYQYDALNRLVSAAATGSSTYNLAFVYDRYGNMTCTINGQTSGLCPTYSFNQTNNRVTNSGYTYDGAGDLTSDGTNTYQYDAEGRLVSVNNSPTTSWSYNALGDRAGWSGPWGTASVLFDPSGQLLSYWNQTNTDWGFERFWLEGRMMAYYNPDAGTMRFEHVNGLDSASMVTDQTGTLVTDQLFYPWGGLWQGANTEDPTFASLLGDDRTEGLYPAKFREYTSNEGRWLSPDPLGGDITNPQSLNRYAYALNNPTTFTDPTGLTPCRIDGSCRGGGGGGGGLNWRSWWPNWGGPGFGGGGCSLEGINVPCSEALSVLQSGAGCLDSCTSSVVGSNGKTYTVVQTAGTPDIYAPNGELLYPDGESVAEVGLQNAENGVYSVFSAMCLNQNCDPFAPVSVQYQFAKGVYNVTWNGTTINTNNLADYWKDPFTLLHNGYPSWFQGSPLTMFNVVHLIGGPDLAGHMDPYGPLDPLHYLIQFPQMLVPAGGKYLATCTLMGGCSLGH